MGRNRKNGAKFRGNEVYQVMLEKHKFQVVYINSFFELKKGIKSPIFEKCQTARVIERGIPSPSPPARCTLEIWEKNDPHG